MHYSAQRGIATACRLSVCLCLSVTLVDQDHTGWKSWKLTAWTILAQQWANILALRSPRNIQHPGEHGEIFGRLDVGEKVTC